MKQLSALSKQIRSINQRWGRVQGRGMCAYTTPASTLSMASPWTTQHSGGDASGVSLYTSTLVSSPGTQSATVTYGNGNTTFSTWAQLVIPIRPAPSLVACPLAAGEQILDWVY